MNKLTVISSIDFTDEEMLYREMDKERIDVLVLGGKPGLDRLVQEYALEKDIPTQIFLADYEKHGRSANYHRNLDLIRNATKILFFWNQRSKSRQTYLSYVVEQNKKFRTILY